MSNAYLRYISALYVKYLTPWLYLNAGIECLVISDSMSFGTGSFPGHVAFNNMPSNADDPITWQNIHHYHEMLEWVTRCLQYMRSVNNWGRLYLSSSVYILIRWLSFLGYIVEFRFQITKTANRCRGDCSPRNQLTLLASFFDWSFSSFLLPAIIFFLLIFILVVIILSGFSTRFTCSRCLCCSFFTFTTSDEDYNKFNHIISYRWFTLRDRQRLRVLHFCCCNFLSTTI